MVLPLIMAFRVEDLGLHLHGLSFPFCIAHLVVAPEKLLIRLPVTTSNPVPQRRELAIVVVEVKI